MSRYSWKHHHFFIDEWGKPLFTMTSSPFAQFGLKGIEFFNILCGLAASYISYRIAEKLNTPFPYLAIIFTFSAPVFFTTIYSGLTEPMFSLMLIWSIWLIINERYYFCAIILSFLPFVRADYIYVWPLFIFYFIIKKKYLANLLLPVGSIIITMIGYFYYKNIHWLIDENPYSIGDHPYGDMRGNVFSYLGNGFYITGTVLEVLVVIGIFWYLSEYFKKSNKLVTGDRLFTEDLVLILGCFLGILGGQTIVWATGIAQTLGPMRYMVPLIPLAAIIALHGLQFITRLFDKIRMHWASDLIAVFISIAVLYAPYTMWYKIPFELGNEEMEIKKATDWLKQSAFLKNKIFHLAPYVTIALDLDPSDSTSNCTLNRIDWNHPDKDMPLGSIMIWDSHYGPNEGRIKLDTLVSNTNLTLLNEFDTDGKDKALKGIGYSVWVFQRK